MATVAEIQAQLDAQGTGRIANILKKNVLSGSVDQWYVVGLVGYAGKCRWVTTTSSESAADQAADILTGLA